jgi:hypothetical protein
LVLSAILAAGRIAIILALIFSMRAALAAVFIINGVLILSLSASRARSTGILGVFAHFACLACVPIVVVELLILPVLAELAQRRLRILG